MNKKMFTAWITMLLVVSLTYSAISQAVIANGTKIRLDPKDNLFTTSTTSVGTKFNVTAWVDNVANLGGAQVSIEFNDTVINVTRWFEPKDTQYVFSGRTTSALPTPPNDVNYQHLGPNRGRSLISVSLFPPNPPYFTGSGKICIFEFKITAAPSDPGKYTSTLKINSGDTYLLDGDGNEITSTKEDGYYEIERPGVPPTHAWLTITTTTGGTTAPAPGVYKHAQGSPVSVQALPASGFAFDNWEVDGEGAGATNPINIVMNVNHTLHAIFTELLPTTFKLRITSTMGGSTNPSPGTYNYPQGSAVSVKATPDAGYLFNHWDLDGEDIGVANPVAVTMNANHDLNAVFQPVVLPTVEKPFDVQWTNYSRDPKYPFWGGMFHNGVYPVWKNFTVLYYGNDELIYISVKYPETTPAFKPSRYEIKTFPYEQKWTIKVNLVDRLVEFTPDSRGMTKGMFAIVSLEFIQGPTAEDNVEHEFAVTVSERATLGQTFYKYETIDKTPPQVDIIFPDATTPGGKGYSFIKRNSDIWVLMPNSTNKNVGWLWINGTASDLSSGINRVEMWVNGTYMGDATLSKPQESLPKSVTWWWRVDPTRDPSFWKTESWYYAVARAYDNSVNSEARVMHGSDKIPKTNSNDSNKHWFFWIGVEGPVVTACIDHKPIEWVPGNGRVDIWAQTGFYPNLDVDIYLENKLYGVKTLLMTVTADNYGRFYITINHLPEVPRKPTAADLWIVNATQKKGDLTLKGADRFAIVPWITYEDTIAQNNPTVWKTTKNGNVFDTFTVYGHGFLPSRQTQWDRYSTVYVRIVYTDVAPLEEWENRIVFNGTGQFNCDKMSWYPRLSETVLAEVRTDSNGYWSAQITIPQSYGGLHAIYAYEYKLVTDLELPGPKSRFDLVKSGWPEFTEIEEEQAVIFDVWPTLEISPPTAITDQYVTIKGEGLPLPRYYKLSKNGMSIISNRDQCLVLDFGPYTQWVFENKRIRNNELDLAWVMETWYPFSYYTPDMAQHLESPVWKGKLTSVTVDYTTEKLQFHIGSKYLKVPMLPAGQYDVTVYYFDKNNEEYVHDHDAMTSVEVLKDPLHVNVDVGKVHFPSEIVNVFAQVDVDGTAADSTILTLELYKGENLVQTLAYSKVGTGSYVATFTCPTEAGDYFIKASASKQYQTFALHGTAISGFTINPTINNISPKLIELEGKIATLQTDMGQVKLDIKTLNGRIVDIDGKVATVITDVGTLKADVTALGAKITSIDGKVATVETNLGTLNVTVTSIGGKVASIENKVATVVTDVGTLKTGVSNINSVITGLHDDVATVHTEVSDLTVKLKDLNGFATVENNVATIKTDLGEIKGKVLTLEGNVATIQTDLGTIKTPISDIKNGIGLQPVTIGLSLLAALAAIAAAVLILRKVYIK